MSDRKKIAFFDFDGTITTRDTLPEIIRFQRGSLSLYTGFLLLSPWLLLYKLGLLANDRAKEILLKYFFGGMREQDFQQNCDAFAETRLPHLIRSGALKEISRLKAEGAVLVIVSASAGNWIRKWSESLSLGLVSTTLQIDNGVLTGGIEGKNCHGEEKVRRIRAIWNLEEYEVYAYGDSKADLPMLNLAAQSFYKPFRNE